MGMGVVTSWLVLVLVVLVLSRGARGNDHPHQTCQVQGLPVIDIGPLLQSGGERTPAGEQAVKEVGDASQSFGFFYITNHGVPEALQERLERASKAFFMLPPDRKRAIAMSTGGKAWRGYFSVGEEVTSGLVDQKEGLYLGVEKDAQDPRPLHGANLYPKEVPELREAVEAYMKNMESLGHVLMRAISTSLGLQPEHFGDQFREPLQLFRIFNYPPHDDRWGADSWAVGEHSDYGYLTLLKQDNSGGLQVRNTSAVRSDPWAWIDVPPLPGTLVVNLGDALEHNSGGLLRATPHRVQQRRNATEGRLSFPFFFDPSFDAELKDVVPHLSPDLQARAKFRRAAHSGRWDGKRVEVFQGTYGDYVLAKVSKVFPQLAEANEILRLKESSEAPR